MGSELIRFACAAQAGVQGLGLSASPRPNPNPMIHKPKPTPHHRPKPLPCKSNGFQAIVMRVSLSATATRNYAHGQASFGIARRQWHLSACCKVAVLTNHSSTPQAPYSALECMLHDHLFAFTNQSIRATLRSHVTRKHAARSPRFKPPTPMHPAFQATQPDVPTISSHRPRCPPPFQATHPDI